MQLTDIAVNCNNKLFGMHYHLTTVICVFVNICNRSNAKCNVNPSKSQKFQICLLKLI